MIRLVWWSKCLLDITNIIFYFQKVKSLLKVIKEDKWKEEVLSQSVLRLDT
jgi:hypothetical protein